MQTPNPGDPTPSPSASESTTPIEISVIETSELIQSGKTMLLLDCREDDEVATCQIDGAVHISMREIPDRMSEIEEFRSDNVVVHCHHGGRSLKVAMWLRENGFPKAQNMTGGIDQWSQQVDPQVPRY